MANIPVSLKTLPDPQYSFSSRQRDTLSKPVTASALKKVVSLSCTILFAIKIRFHLSLYMRKCVCGVGVGVGVGGGCLVVQLNDVYLIITQNATRTQQKLPVAQCHHNLGIGSI